MRTRERGSKWDLDGKLGVRSGAIQVKANRTEFDNNWAASRLSSERHFTQFGFTAPVTIVLRYVTYHVLLTFRTINNNWLPQILLRSTCSNRLTACRDHAAPMTVKLRLRHSPSPAPLSFDSLPSTPPPSPPPASLSGLPPPTSWLSARDMKIFGADPLKSTSEIGLVQCKDCAKPILRSAIAEHAGTVVSF